jgi:hypothetical protein
VAPIYWIVWLEKCLGSMRLESVTLSMDELLGKVELAILPSVWFLTYSGSVNI